MKKTVGTLIFCLSLLVFSIVVMLAQLSLYVDRLHGSYVNTISSHIPVIVYIFTGITILISLILIFEDVILKFDKK